MNSSRSTISSRSSAIGDGRFRPSPWDRQCRDHHSIEQFRNYRYGIDYEKCYYE